MDVGRPVRVAAAALPGSATADLAASVIASWTAHALVVAEDLVAYADALVASADTYRLTESVVFP